ncbi:hypothetical protein M3Y97_01118900 [Aphelenchoides bicaudatus]|nr:hypothetical protein M3Y97_01118900 [Aphelenchoides bicaudatus]
MNKTMARTIFYSNKKKLTVYSWMFLISAAFDALFSCVALFAQHQLTVRDGIMFISPLGIETLIGGQTYLFIQLPQIFLIQHCVLILAAQYKFRYEIIKSSKTAGTQMIKYACVTAFFSLISGILAIFSAHKSKQRGVDYYQQKLGVYKPKTAPLVQYAFDMV